MIHVGIEMKKYTDAIHTGTYHYHVFSKRYGKDEILTKLKLEIKSFTVCGCFRNRNIAIHLTNELSSAMPILIQGDNDKF